MEFDFDLDGVRAKDTVPNSEIFRDLDSLAFSVIEIDRFSLLHIMHTSYIFITYCNSYGNLRIKKERTILITIRLITALLTLLDC